MILAAVVAFPVASNLVGYLGFAWNTVAGRVLCVSAGEPLYPGTTLVRIDEFRRFWGSPPPSYQITVNMLSREVTVRDPDGPRLLANGVNFPLVIC